MHNSLISKCVTIRYSSIVLSKHVSRAVLSHFLFDKVNQIKWNTPTYPPQKTGYLVATRFSHKFRARRHSDSLLNSILLLGNLGGLNWIKVKFSKWSVAALSPSLFTFLIWVEGEDGGWIMGGQLKTQQTNFQQKWCCTWDSLEELISWRESRKNIWIVPANPSTWLVGEIPLPRLSLGPGPGESWPSQSHFPMMFNLSKRCGMNKKGWIQLSWPNAVKRGRKWKWM